MEGYVRKWHHFVLRPKRLNIISALVKETQIFIMKLVGKSQCATGWNHMQSHQCCEEIVHLTKSRNNTRLLTTASGSADVVRDSNQTVQYLRCLTKLSWTHLGNNKQRANQELNGAVTSRCHIVYLHLFLFFQRNKLFLLGERNKAREEIRMINSEIEKRSCLLLHYVFKL